MTLVPCWTLVSILVLAPTAASAAGNDPSRNSMRLAASIPFRSLNIVRTDQRRGYTLRSWDHTVTVRRGVFRTRVTTRRNGTVVNRTLIRKSAMASSSRLLSDVYAAYQIGALERSNTALLSVDPSPTPVVLLPQDIHALGTYVATKAWRRSIRFVPAAWLKLDGFSKSVLIVAGGTGASATAGVLVGAFAGFTPGTAVGVVGFGASFIASLAADGSDDASTYAHKRHEFFNRAISKINASQVFTNKSLMTP